ncbi:c-type cytochrome [Variovorax sp. J22R133]|uniref:c-type cytochrome n=1 Tax=Variovorax brevis TaxID=3053503 RepID=UPI002576BFD4|nr:c-type cytochrome [Variovorax sp. J22R133]MDM0117786.1 c-type cytochrome [Variovorax sp. J22R133]
MKALTVMLALCAALPAMADQKLAEKKNCLACHGMKDKVVGPGFKEIAAKYAGQASASQALADKIQKGGVGVWGQIPMPPNDVTPAEAKTLADWVLGMK